MAFDTAETAALQADYDSFPDDISSVGIEGFTADLADMFRKFADGDSQLLSNADELEKVGYELGWDETSPIVHYHKGSPGYTEFAGAYAKAFRRLNAVTQARIDKAGSIWNWDTWGKAVKDTVKGIADAPGDLLGDYLKKILAGAWPIIGLVLAAMVGIVLVAAFTKGKISVS